MRVNSIRLLLFVLLCACSGERATEYVQRGDQLRRDKKYPEAIAAFSNALRLAPQDRGALLGLGQTFEDSGDLKQALETYNKITEKDPKHVMACLHVANALRRLGRIQEALAKLEECTKLSPGEAFIKNLLAKLYEQSGNGSKALENYQQAVLMQQNDYEFSIDLARFYDRLGQREKALAEYHRLLSLFSGLDAKALANHKDLIAFAQRRIAELEKQSFPAAK